MNGLMDDVRKDGVINGGTGGITVSDYELFGCRGYLILWYAWGVEAKDISTRRLLPPYGATRYICDALNLRPFVQSQSPVGERVQRSADSSRREHEECRYTVS